MKEYSSYGSIFVESMMIIGHMNDSGTALLTFRVDDWVNEQKIRVVNSTSILYGVNCPVPRIIEYPPFINSSVPFRISYLVIYPLPRSSIVC